MGLSKISRFPVWLATSGDHALSVMRIGPQRWSWLMRRDGRDVAEGEAGDLEAVFHERDLVGETMPRWLAPIWQKVASQLLRRGYVVDTQRMGKMMPPRRTAAPLLAAYRRLVAAEVRPRQPPTRIWCWPGLVRSACSFSRAIAISSSVPVLVEGKTFTTLRRVSARFRRLSDTGRGG